jgi:hypothetical protein
MTGDDTMTTDNDCEDHAAAGEVSVAEAFEILNRFINSHWHAKDPNYDRARFSIPANPLRDDDIRLGAFISRAENAFTEIDALRALVVARRDCIDAADVLRESVIGDTCPAHDPHCDSDGTCNRCEQLDAAEEYDAARAALGATK